MATFILATFSQKRPLEGTLLSIRDTELDASAELDATIGPQTLSADYLAPLEHYMLAIFLY